MATNYIHAQTGIVDAEGNVNVIYPVTYAKDVLIDTSESAYLSINNLDNGQAFAKKVGEDLQRLTGVGGDANAASHNSIYRGADIATLDWCGKNSDGTISADGLTELRHRISAGTFDDLYVGDFFKVGINTTLHGNETVTLVIAEFDSYLNKGDTETTVHHVVLVPMYCFNDTAVMNTTASTNGGYSSTSLRSNILPSYGDALNTALKNGLISRRTLVSSEAGSESTDYTWVTSKIDLLNEVQIFGTNEIGNRFDVGCENSQLKYFMYNPNAVMVGANTRTRNKWWIRSVASATEFATVNGYGMVEPESVSTSLPFRAFMLLG